MTDWTPERIGRLADAYGGPFALARELGVNDETLRLWRRGQRNPGGSARKLMAILEHRKPLANRDKLVENRQESRRKVVDKPSTRE